MTNNFNINNDQQGTQSNTQILFDAVFKKAIFFKDQYGKVFAKIQDDSGHQILSLKSRHFHYWLIQLYRTTLRSLASPATIQQILTNLEAEAFYSGKVYPLHVRVAKFGDGFWYNLGNTNGSAICIKSTGWGLVDNPPIIFRTPDASLPQIMPIAEGSIEQLLKLSNIKDIDQQLLFLVTVVTLLIPNISYPAIIVHGHQGSAKTTLLRMLKKVIDPSKSKPSVLSGKKEDICLQLSQNHLVTFDNVDTVKGWQSDLLCQAVTGGSIEKRELYTDEDIITINFKGAIALNGINLAASRSDLLDRSIIFELQRIEGNQLETEDEFWEKFNDTLPSILGGLFDILCAAMHLYPTITPSKLFRMADYTRWGCAIAEAMGYGSEAFISAYENNRKIGTEKAIGSNPIAETIRILMFDRTDWHGTVGELYKELLDIARKQCFNNVYEFPKGSFLLIASLKKIEVDLKSQGITVSPGIKTRNGKLVTIQKILPSDDSIHNGELILPSEGTSSINATICDAADDGDDDNLISSC